MGNFGMRFRAKTTTSDGCAKLGTAGGGGFSRQPSHSMHADRAKGVNLSGREKKIEKVVRFGAFWCMTCGTALASTPHMVFDAPSGRMFYGTKMREVMRWMPTLPPPFPAWRHRHHTDGRRSRPGLRSVRPTALGRFPDRSRPARRTSAHRWWRHRRTGACWWSYI